MPQASLIATLGSEPQVVTIVLDRLLAQGQPIDQALVVHTGAPAVLAALRAVQAEFDAHAYAGIGLQAVPVQGLQGPVEDLHTEEDMWALLRTLYSLLRSVKRAGRTAHLCISGGRKAMGIAGMVSAQLLFDGEDRAWHLISEGWAPGGARRLHLPPDEPVWLVPVPVLRWTSSSAMLAALANLEEPADAIALQQRFVQQEQRDRERAFFRTRLTPAERTVVALACRGLDNAAIAAQLHKSPRTVANQLTAIYAKLHEWLGFPPDLPDRSVLIAALAPCLAQEEGIGRDSHADMVIRADARQPRG
ncbi:MAG: CRISPR-associated ring nuclease [Anaerolineae bacterium]